jgi:hypothetical protein
MPDLRWDKVQRIREAVRRDAYENERIIDVTVERVLEKVGAKSTGPGASHAFY